VRKREKWREGVRGREGEREGREEKGEVESDYQRLQHLWRELLRASQEKKKRGGGGKERRKGGKGEKREMGSGGAGEERSRPCAVGHATSRND
jgi:hypothetical protein